MHHCRPVLRAVWIGSALATSWPEAAGEEDPGAALKVQGSAYGFAALGARFSLIVPRTVAMGGVAFPCSGELTGIDVETFPGGGEPSAVKSDFCSASVFAGGAGATAGLFIPMAFAVTRDAPCSAAGRRRLSASAHDAIHKALTSPRPGPMAGGHSFVGRRATARKRLETRHRSSNDQERAHHWQG